jgi:RNA polymerase sigma-B factor
MSRTIAVVSAQQPQDELLSRFAKTGDPALRDEIIASALWLATRGARHFVNRGEPLDDLLQVARIGLLKALDRFDPELGVPFSAFANQAIEGELRRHFRDCTWIIHVPRRAKEMRQAVANAADVLAPLLERPATACEIAGYLGAPTALVIDAQRASAARHPDTIDPTDRAGGRNLPHEGYDEDEILDREVVCRLLNRLKQRERTVVYLRFFEELSQAQIAKLVGTSQAHAGRLIAASLRELSTYLTEDDLAGQPQQAASTT